MSQTARLARLLEGCMADDFDTRMVEFKAALARWEAAEKAMHEASINMARDVRAIIGENMT